MDKILIALVMFLIVMTIKKKIEKEAEKKLEKDLKKVLSGKVNAKKLPKDCAQVIANVLPEEFKANKSKFKKGLAKVADVAAQPDSIAEYKSSAKQKKLLS